MTDQVEDLAPYLARVDYAYYVVTVRSHDGATSGCLAGFVTQCSIDPPNFLVCISKVNHTYTVAQRSTAMGRHLLGADQVELARRFGEETGDLVDKFAGLDWQPGPQGAPCSPSRRSASRVSSSATSPSATTMPSCSAAPIRSDGGHPGLLTYRTSSPIEPGHPVPG